MAPKCRHPDGTLHAIIIYIDMVICETCERICSEISISQVKEAVRDSVDVEYPAPLADIAWMQHLVDPKRPHDLQPTTRPQGMRYGHDQPGNPIGTSPHTVNTMESSSSQPAVARDKSPRVMSASSSAAAERRVAQDGHPYTWEEFVDCYGCFDAATIWTDCGAAQPAADIIRLEL